jgi:hypothetical protein
METKNSTYLILSIILLILSVIGGYFLFQNFQAVNQGAYITQTTPKIELIPTDVIEETQPTIIPTIAESSTSAKISITPTSTISATKITPTKILTLKSTSTPIPTKSISTSPSSGSFENYSSSTDAFSISYSVSRQLVQDTENSGNRYTFVSSYVGNFAVHVSPSGTWAWVNPDRQFSTDFTVSGQPTFRYDIATQTIVDLQSSTKNYTLQCVHNGVASVKEECEAFISSFTLL